MSANDHTDTTNGVGAPYVDKARRFTVFNIDELYTGPTGKGQYVPNVNDLVVNYPLNILQRVTAVDYTTYKYTLVVWRPTSIYNTDVIIGNVGNRDTSVYRVLVDNSVYPATLRLDSRLTMSGLDLDSIRVFRGTDVSANGEVISATIVGGVLKSDTLPLVPVVLDSGVFTNSYIAAQGYCTADVESGELVTIVAMADSGEVVSIAQATIVLTNIVMAVDAPTRQIVDIRLKSPFMSPGNDRLLQLPINIPIADIPLHVEVQYNDGIKKLSLDGTRCWLNGLDSSPGFDDMFISSILGQTLPLLLCYKLGSNETYVGNDVTDGVIVRDYSATTQEVDGAYSLKLFVVPKWVNSATGYRLEYYLYDLTRGNVFNATNYVKPAANSASFDPTLYGTKQRLAVTLDISKVSTNYIAHIHAQTFAITLLAEGTEKTDNYYLEYQQNQPEFGKGCLFEFEYDNTTYWKLDLRSGCATKAEWLAKMYEPIYPLFDRRTEAGPPTPTHFVVVTKTKSYTKTIDQWVAPFNVDYQLNEAEPILIKWLQRTPNDDLHLGMTSLLAHQSLAV